MEEMGWDEMAGCIPTRLYKSGWIRFLSYQASKRSKRSTAGRLGLVFNGIYVYK
jgi:hypothetical protein